MYWGFWKIYNGLPLFVLNINHDIVWDLVYFDDIIVTGSNNLYFSWFIIRLHHQFLVKDLGPISFILGIKGVLCSTGLWLTQHKYIRDLLARNNMLNSKSSASHASISQVPSSIILSFIEVSLGPSNTSFYFIFIFNLARLKLHS